MWASALTVGTSEYSGRSSHLRSPNLIKDRKLVNRSRYSKDHGHLFEVKNIQSPVGIKGKRDKEDQSIMLNYWSCITAILSHFLFERKVECAPKFSFGWSLGNLMTLHSVQMCLENLCGDPSWKHDHTKTLNQIRFLLHMGKSSSSIYCVAPGTTLMPWSGRMGASTWPAWSSNWTLMVSRLVDVM